MVNIKLYMSYRLTNRFRNYNRSCCCRLYKNGWSFATNVYIYFVLLRSLLMYTCILMLMLSQPISPLLSLQMWINHLTHGLTLNTDIILSMVSHISSYCRLYNVDWLEVFILVELVHAGSCCRELSFGSLFGCLGKKQQNSLQFCCSYNRVLLKDFTETDRHASPLV